MNLSKIWTEEENDKREIDNMINHKQTVMKTKEQFNLKIFSRFNSEKIVYEHTGEEKSIKDVLENIKGWADLSWANLSGANLCWADLIGADLSGADLSGADLRRAKLLFLIISGLKHTLIAHEKSMQIGCVINDYEWWKTEQWKEKAEENKYTPEQIEEYQNHIDVALKMFSK